MDHQFISLSHMGLGAAAEGAGRSRRAPVRSAAPKEDGRDHWRENRGKSDRQIERRSAPREDECDGLPQCEDGVERDRARAPASMEPKRSCHGHPALQGLK